MHFLFITDKSKAVDAGMSEEQMEEGKCMGHMPPRFGLVRPLKRLARLLMKQMQSSRRSVCRELAS